MCYEKGFLAKLINELTECYNTEMTILPQIYDHITKLSHSKTDKSNTMCLPFKLGSRSNDYLEYEVPNPVMYVTKLDIVRNGGCYSRPDFEYVLLNGSVKYYLEQDHSNHIPLRTVKFPAFLVNSITEKRTSFTLPTLTLLLSAERSLKQRNRDSRRENSMRQRNPNNSICLPE